jgi:hypothetical protein
MAYLDSLREKEKQNISNNDTFLDYTIIQTRKAFAMLSCYSK